MNPSHLFRFSLSLLLIGSLFTACDTFPPKAADSADSTAVSIEAPSSTSRGIPQGQPELLGTWRLIESKVANLPMAEDIVGKLTLEFTADGQVISNNPELGPATFPINQTPEGLVIDDGIGGQSISAIEANHLIITYMIDQEEVIQKYERVE